MKKFFDDIVVDMNKPLTALASFSHRVASEGIVLLKNEDNVLPLINKKISIFGRIQTDYYKSGTGSGGLVNVSYVTSILEGLMQNPQVEINKNLLETYLKWISDNPFNAGNGMWASEPWSQSEMPLNDELVMTCAKQSDVAIIIIGRTAGEDRDNYPGAGSYLLTENETAMIKIVSKYFKDIVLVLNVGNIIDLSIMDTCHISSVLYVWHGGMEGGRAVSDVLCGDITPSGKLCDTIAYSIDDYPSAKNFGDKEKNYYQEDIYVGYRYFETFCPQQVRYPFGFGLSYTEFELTLVHVTKNEKELTFEIAIKNNGQYNGKEVVQIYYGAPQGHLGQPIKQLIAFAKTKLLKPKQTAKISITINIDTLASFDDSGVSGHQNCYVLENGEYEFYLGNNVRDSKKVFSFNLDELIIVQQCQEALAPKEAFTRIKPFWQDGQYLIAYEDVPTRTIDLKQRISDNTPLAYNKINDNKYILKDVYDCKLTLKEFVAQLSATDLACIVRGEGMSSPKVTPGTAAAFGGVSESLLGFGIPVACASDGPSGIRMDSGQQATSLPIGTCLACTMNYELVKELYFLEGKELSAYNIDTLLGPGMNIHRHPLNGRNFEYFSEDPLLTGIMGQAVTAGLQSAGNSGTLKHLACNNQERARFDADSIVSQRALREIYLKGFEIAVKYGKSRAIMTSYNPINGIWAAGNYDLNTLIVRQEWGFDGLIMTDWWAKMNDDNGIGTKANTKAMIRAQNDLYMVVPNAEANPNDDNTLNALDKQEITLGHLHQTAYNICNFLLQTQVFKRSNGIDVNENDYQEEFIFKVSHEEYDLPLLNDILVDGKSISDFNAYCNIYYIKGDEKYLPNIVGKAEDKNEIKIVKPRIGCNVTTIIVANDYCENIYRVIVMEKNRKKHDAIIDMESITPRYVNIVSEIGWDQVILDLKQPSYQSKIIKVNNDGIIIDCNRYEVITYALEVLAYGKYIVELIVASSVSNLSQIPFSIFIDEENKSTLTMGATGENFVTINTHIIIDAGLHYLSLRFGRSGLTIKQIKIIKHN